MKLHFPGVIFETRICDFWIAKFFQGLLMASVTILVDVNGQILEK